jgi:hypothetical protein
MAANIVPTIDRAVNQVWNVLQAELPKMGGDARPKHAADAFAVVSVDAAGIRLRVNPISFRVKEKAGSSGLLIYVTIEGDVLFSPNCTRQNLLTTQFATRVGYFREVDAQRLKHVFGVHYDYDGLLQAHPVYHSQMASMVSFIDHINRLYNTAFEPIADEDDLVRGLLGNVRIPTAQMDPFSVFVQVVGDHLVSDASDPAVAAAFSNVRRSMAAFRSDPDAAPRLQQVLNLNCFRSHHWYL